MNKLVIGPEPVTLEEKNLLKEMQAAMTGDGRHGLEYFLQLSSEFTIPENTENYLPEMFFKARASYIRHKYYEEMKAWP